MCFTKVCALQKIDHKSYMYIEKHIFMMKILKTNAWQCKIVLSFVKYMNFLLGVVTILCVLCKQENKAIQLFIVTWFIPHFVAIT